MLQYADEVPPTLSVQHSSFGNVRALLQSSRPSLFNLRAKLDFHRALLFLREICNSALPGILNSRAELTVISPMMVSKSIPFVDTPRTESTISPFT